MNYRRALITGAAGLLGSHIADRLVTVGYRGIIVLDWAGEHISDVRSFLSTSTTTRRACGR
jgi:nucleoside-diphosphate-sugar epimerase